MAVVFRFPAMVTATVTGSIQVDRFWYSALPVKERKGKERIGFFTKAIIIIFFLLVYVFSTQ